jgi:hypothetical protein
MPVFRLSKMLLKSKDLYMPFHDIDENKGVY